MFVEHCMPAGLHRLGAGHVVCPHAVAGVFGVANKDALDCSWVETA